MSQTAIPLLAASGGFLTGATIAGLIALRLKTRLAATRTRLRKQERATTAAQVLVERLRRERDTYHQQALEDDTTRLPNRRAAIARLTDAVGTRRPVGVVVLDLIGFKRVNDRLGHRAGNLLLAQVAERLQRLQRVAGADAARLSGDEFTLIVHGDADRTAKVAGLAWAAISRTPFILDGRRIDITASVGHTTTDSSRDPESLLHHADIAQYWAKANGGGVYRYTAHMGDNPHRGRPRDWPPPHAR